MRSPPCGALWVCRSVPGASPGSRALGLLAHSQPELVAAAWGCVPRGGLPTGSTRVRAEGGLFPFPGVKVESFQCPLSPEGKLQAHGRNQWVSTKAASPAFVVWLLWKNAVYRLRNYLKMDFGKVTCKFLDICDGRTENKCSVQYQVTTCTRCSPMLAAARTKSTEFKTVQRTVFDTVNGQDSEGSPECF